MFKRLYEVLSLATETNISVLLWGERGVGKTEFSQEAIKQLGYDIRIIRTAGKEDTDFSGIPIEIDNRMHYAAPEWMPFNEWQCSVCNKEYGEAYSEKTPCPSCNGEGKPVKRLILFDEINRGSDDVLQALFEFVSNKSFDGRRFASGTRIVATANPAGGSGYVVNAFNDKAFLSRWAHIIVGIDGEYFEEYYKYLSQRYNSDIVMKAATYIGEDMSKLVGKDKVDDLGFNIEPNPRSWVWALKAYAIGTEKNYDPNVIKDLMSGLVGNGEVMAFFNTNVRVKASDIIKHWSTMKHKVIDILKTFTRPEHAALNFSIVNELQVNKIEESVNNVIEFLEHASTIQGNRDLVAAATYSLMLTEYKRHGVEKMIVKESFREAVDDITKEINSLKLITRKIMKSNILRGFCRDIMQDGEE